MSDSTPLRRRASDVDAIYIPIRSAAGQDVGDTRDALSGVLADARRANEMIAEIEHQFDDLRRLADAQIVIPMDQVREPAPVPRRRQWIGLAIGAVVLLSTWGLGASNRTTSADTVASLEGAEFTGTIKPSQRVMLTSGSGGPVLKVLVTVGDSVTPGQPLVEMDDAAARAALDNAVVEHQYAVSEASHWQRSIADLDQSIQNVSAAFAQSLGTLAVAQRQVEQVPGRQFRDSPERAQAVFDQESSRLQRLRKLHAQSLVSDEQLEEQSTAVRIAENDLENARRWQAAAVDLQRAQQDQAQQQIARSRSEFQQLRADHVARLAQARARADQAQQRVDAAREQLAGSVLRATTAGVVVEVAVEVGSRPAAGATLVTLAKLNDLLVEVPVSSKIVNLLQVGDTATVTLPTLPPQRVDGRIASINPIPAQNMTHAIEVEFANSSGQLWTGQRAQVLFR